MARSPLYRLLENPRVYRAAQAVLSPGSDALYARYDTVFADSRGTVLDVGCGPLLDTPQPAGVLVGVDVNEDYLVRYVEPRGPDDGRRLAVAASAATLPFADRTFDEARCAIVLHHLPDEVAAEALREMVRVVRPGGRVVVFDVVRPPGFRSAPIAWTLARLDRGEWMRTAAELLELVRGLGVGTWRSDEFVYSWYRIHGMALVLDRH